jgi:hypothetical protein
VRKFVGLLLCLSLSFFIVGRAAKPSHTPAAGAKTAQKPTGLKADAKTLLNESPPEEEISSEESNAKDESFDMYDAEQEEVAAEEATDEEVATADNDSIEDASDDEGEDMSDADHGAGGPSDEDIGDDDGGNDDGTDDGGGDDSSGDEGD